MENKKFIEEMKEFAAGFNGMIIDNGSNGSVMIAEKDLLISWAYKGSESPYRLRYAMTSGNLTVCGNVHQIEKIVRDQESIAFRTWDDNQVGLNS